MFWVAVLIYLLPVGALWLALMIVGVRLLPASESQPQPPVAVGPFNVWEQVLARVEMKINRHSFFTWFSDTVFVSDDGSLIEVRVLAPMVGEWIAEHHADVLKTALVEVGRADAGVVFVSGDFRLRVV